MSLRISTSVSRAAHHSGLAGTCAKIHDSRLTTEDTLKFFRSLKAQVEETERWQGYTAALGVATYGVVVVCDILMDVVEKPTKRTPVGFVLEKVYAKAREYRTSRAPKNEQVEKMKKLKKLMREQLPKELRPLADGFVNMAENFTHMVAFMQDANESAAIVRKSKSDLQKQIGQLEEKLAKLVEAYETHCEPPPPNVEIRLR